MNKLTDIFRRLRPDNQRSRVSILLIALAAVLIELTSAVQYWYAEKRLAEEMKHRAETELKVKNLEIQKVMTAVESAVGNTAWTVEQRLLQPDSIYSVIARLSKQNEMIVGAAVCFAADYYPQKGHWFEPYAFDRADGDVDMEQIGGPDHDYLNRSWFREAMAAEGGYWSEPYFDEAGAKMMLCTYFYPVRDVKGKVVAVLGADVSLDWLSTTINAHHIYPSSYNVLISRTGQMMACRVESLVLRKTIQEVTASLEDTTVREVNRRMMSGRSGQATVFGDDGEKNYVFYAPVEGDTGWSMAVVCSDKEIFLGLRQVGFNLLLMMLAGLALMVYLVWRSIRNARKLEVVNNQKTAIESELRIANGIQMALLPKIFPPFPNRDDVDVYGMVKPAKEVGGDLYDFFIRDEKLFFCVGDVAGKGVPASLVMAITRTLFRTVSAHEAQPNRILSAINHVGAEENPNNVFVTFFVGVLDLPTGCLRYSCAGHEPPVLISSDGVEKLSCDTGIPIGVLDDWRYTTQETIIQPQTTIFLYTDGLTEAMTADNVEYGRERMMSTLDSQRTRMTDACTLVEGLVASVHDFVGGAEQSDDLTMLAIRYTKQQLAERFNRSLTLPNDVTTVPQLSDFVQEVCEEVCFDKTTTGQVRLAVEEAVVNVMNYAYPTTRGTVEIVAVANDERLKFMIIDSGSPFDPTAKEEVDINLPGEERPIGGLGIHLVRHLMDSMNYNRVDGKNILTLRKKIPRP